MRILAIGAVAIVVGVATPALAMDIDTGQWRFTNVSQTPMGPQESTETTCIDDGTMTPEKFMEDMDGCTLTDSASTSNAMSWSFSCPTGMSGQGEMQSTGSSVTGTMTATMQSMTMTQTWKGERVGDCP